MSAIAVQAPQMPRHKRAQTRFLKRLREGMTVLEAASHAGVNRRTLYRWRENDQDFAAAWERAYEQGIDALVNVAQKRAVNGSDPLLMFLIKQRDPSFRENHSVQVSGQIEHSGMVEIEDRSASLADVARVLEAVGAIAEHSGATARRSLPAAS